MNTKYWFGYITFTDLDCSQSNCNYYQPKPYKIPRLHVWMTYRWTCLGIMINYKQVSKQAYIHLPRILAKPLEMAFDRISKHRLTD